MNRYKKAKDDYEKTMLKLWVDKKWISNIDFAIATHGSPKFTSRISDMRKKGYEIEDRWVKTQDGTKHKEYALISVPA